MSPVVGYLVGCLDSEWRSLRYVSRPEVGDRHGCGDRHRDPVVETVNQCRDARAAPWGRCRCTRNHFRTSQVHAFQKHFPKPGARYGNISIPVLVLPGNSRRFIGVLIVAPLFSKIAKCFCPTSLAGCLHTSQAPYWHPAGFTVGPARKSRRSLAESRIRWTSLAFRIRTTAPGILAAMKSQWRPV